MSGPLIDWSDEDVRAGIRTSSVHTSYAYNDYLRELERRAAERQARDSRILSIVSVAIALVVSALR